MACMGSYGSRLHSSHAYSFHSIAFGALSLTQIAMGDSYRAPAWRQSSSPAVFKYIEGRVIPYLGPLRDSQLQLSVLTIRFSVLTVSILVAAAIAAPAANPATAKRHVTHEKRDSFPVNWRRNAKFHPDSTLHMRIALTQSNLDKADEFLMDVSHPTSPNFGKH